MIVSKIIGLCVLLGLASAKVRYEGYKVLRIVPETTKELEILRRLSDDVEDIEDKVEFWTLPTHIGNPVDIMVPPHIITELVSALEDGGIAYSVHIENVQALIDEEASTDRVARDAEDVGLKQFDYNIYHEYHEIMQWESDIDTEYDIVDLLNIGQSYEGRDIKVLKIGSKDKGKPAVYIQGGVHGREWISPATMLNIANGLVSNYDSDSEVKAMLDGFDWYILPVLNADGYAYSWENDRMWRKNRQRHSGSRCVGVDLSRNYDYAWGTGSSSISCSETYHGPRPTSEPELVVITNFLQNNEQPIHAHVDFHSYGQYWLYPWSHTTENPLEVNHMQKLAEKATDALYSLYGTHYDVGSSGRLFYPMGGASEDWSYSVLGAKYSYTVHLRDTGKFGFFLPENQIKEVGIETFAAIKELGRHLVEEYGHQQY